MSWATYGTYVLFATVVVIAPGQDFALVVRNSVVGGRRAGLLTSLGVCSSNLVQGSAAALGLGALIVSSQPVFETIRWLGVGYLVFLGSQAIWSAIRGAYPAVTDGDEPRQGHGWLRWRQGFLSNITNPKVLALYLSVLPQFLQAGHTSTVHALGLAYTHATLSLLWLFFLVTVLHQVRAWIRRRRVRRAVDAFSGTALLGFGLHLATENH